MEPGKIPYMNPLREIFATCQERHKSGNACSVGTHGDSVLVKPQGLAQLGGSLRENADHGVCIALRQALHPLQGGLQPALGPHI